MERKIEEIVAIEIKQDKEDMEEKGQCGDNRFEIIAKAKEALLNETNIARDEQEMAVIDNILFRCWQMGWLDKYDDTKHSNSEKIGKNLRPFSLEAARSGKPVCTRDGRKARIICFDRKSETPITVLVTEINGIEAVYSYPNNGIWDSPKRTNGCDLMMLPEKKEMWLARDKNGKLFVFYETKPYKDEDRGSWFNEEEWQEVPDHWFPEVKWEDNEPKELI